MEDKIYRVVVLRNVLRIFASENNPFFAVAGLPCSSAVDDVITF
ncbi:MAG: hypothetical protein JWQ40_3287, partial [Segetibacter sp.]|nr:hypothetical protein [Segetibacter sp.]